MLAKFTEVYRVGRYEADAYSLRETYVNPVHVVYLREDFETPDLIEKTKSLLNLDKRQEFTTIYINNGNHGLRVTVVGSMGMTQDKLQLKKEVLRG